MKVAVITGLLAKRNMDVYAAHFFSVQFLVFSDQLGKVLSAQFLVFSI